MTARLPLAQAFKGIALVVGAGLALVGCATTEGYRQLLESFVGMTSDTLLVEFGPPSSRDDLEAGGEVWSYLFEEERSDPGGYRTIPRERRITILDTQGNEQTRVERYEETIYQPPRSWVARCETRFVIDEASRVRDFRFDGNACVAEELY